MAECAASVFAQGFGAVEARGGGGGGGAGCQAKD